MSKVLLTYTPDAKGNLSRERLQLHPRDRSLAGIKRDNCRVHEREKLSDRRPACYIATPARFPTTLLRARRVAFRPANHRFFVRNYSPTRSCTLLRRRRTRVRLPAPPQNLMILPSVSLDGAGQRTRVRPRRIFKARRPRGWPCAPDDFAPRVLSPAERLRPAHGSTHSMVGAAEK